MTASRFACALFRTASVATMTNVVLSCGVPLVRIASAPDGKAAGNPRPPNSPSCSNGAAQNHGPRSTTTLPTALTAASAPTVWPSGVTPDGHTVGALAAVNAVGSVVVDRGPWFWAAPFEQDGEFGGRGFPAALPSGALAIRTKGTPQESTTLVIVATDAVLNKAQAKRLAVMAQSGLSRAIYPVHTPLDGDVVFAASTGRRPLGDAQLGLTGLGAVAANVVARAIARGVFAATALPLLGAMRTWQDEFGR